MPKRQAIIETRKLANAVIEQLERKANGWDKDFVAPSVGDLETHLKPYLHEAMRQGQAENDALLARVAKLEEAIQDALTRDMPNKSRAVLGDALKR